MKIEQKFVSYTGQLQVGYLSYFLKIGKFGMFMDIKDLSEELSNFPTCTLFNRPFLERDEVPKLIKKVLRHKPEYLFFIHTNGVDRPVGLGKFDNVKYNIHIPLKKSGLSFDDRVVVNTIGFFVQIEGNFIFDVSNENDIDEVTMLVKMVGLPKHKVFVSPSNAEKFDNLLLLARKYKFGFAPDFRKLLWSNDEK